MHSFTQEGRLQGALLSYDRPTQASGTPITDCSLAACPGPFGSSVLGDCLPCARRPECLGDPILAGLGSARSARRTLRRMKIQ